MKSPTVFQSKLKTKYLKTTLIGGRTSCRGKRQTSDLFTSDNNKIIVGKNLHSLKVTLVCCFIKKLYTES